MLPALLTRWLPIRKSKNVRRNRPLGIELLEDRIVPSTDILVGRVLSAYTVGSVQNSSLDVTYTVYNQSADDVTGVLLTTTLQPGVSFASATALPDRNGQELAWSLGSIPGYGRTSVTLTVTLPAVPPLQIDSGAEAFATRNAGMVTDDTPAAALVSRVIPADQLAATPDANSADPFIQEKAAELDYDPQRIFNYLREEVGYESYVGSLRGARGTLWSNAGNALDEASLGVALFRASGIPARYAQGTLSDPLAQQLILSMFPPSFQTVGYIPPGTEVADPANVPQLLSETRSHFWIQFDTGTGFQSIDTTFANAAIGQTFAPSAGTFTEVADAQRHKVTVRLNVETYSQASQFINITNGLSTQTVLDETFNSVELVGRPLSLGHFVVQSGIGSPTFVSRTTTYTPYIAMGDEALPLRMQPEAMTGTPYQEVQTNFPLGNILLSGLFLAITTDGPAGPTLLEERALFDRIGFAAREGLATTSVTVDPDAGPALSDLNVWTLHVLPGLGNAVGSAALLGDLAVERAVLAAAAPDAPVSPEEQRAARQHVISLTRQVGAGFALVSDVLTGRLAAVAGVRAYTDTPRVVIVSHTVTVTGQNATGSFSIDLRRDTVRVVAVPEQQPAVVQSFNAARGLVETATEATIVQQVTGAARVENTATVMAAAIDQRIPILRISAENLSVLQSLTLPSDAEARMTRAIQAGRVVIVPASPVTLVGHPTTAWYDIDPVTGELIGVTQDGGHQGISEYYNLLGILAGTGALATLSAIGQYSLFNLKLPSRQQLVDIKHGVINLITGGAGLGSVLNDAGGGPILIGLETGAVLILAILTLSDPDASRYLLNPVQPPLEPSNTRTAEILVPPTLVAGDTNGQVRTAGVKVHGTIAATWTSQGFSQFSATAVQATSATVTTPEGMPVGTGTVDLALGASAVQATLSGPANISISGIGSLSFYGAADPRLGTAGEWDEYTSAVSGAVVLTLTTDALRLNGQLLPAGTYRVTTAAATLAGRGATASPNYADPVAMSVTGGSVRTAPGTGSVTVSGQPLDSVEGLTFCDFTGSLSMASDDATADVLVSLDGQSAQVLAVSTTPGDVTADQNTPVTFRVNIFASSAGRYSLSAEAPSGWTLALDTAGEVSVLPAPGVQAGTYSVKLTARSTTNLDLLAETVVTVTVASTASGVSLTVASDPQFFVPFNLVKAPTAFRATIRNLGPLVDAFSLSLSNPPVGFSFQQSAMAVSIPAGATGILGLYLEPTGTLPPPGTVVTFDVTATSTTNAAITRTRTVTFTVPQIHGVTLTADRPSLGSTPGVGANVALTLRSVGNVAETVVLTATLPTGLSLGGLTGTVPLALGGSQTLNLTLTPDSNVPLNSTLAVTITATFASGELGVQTIQIPIRVVAPGADAAASAAGSATQAGNGDLANRLSDLATGITNLFQTTDSAVFKAQVLAALDAVAGLVAADYFLGPLVPAPTAARAALIAAVTQTEIRDALTQVGDYLEVLEPQLLAVARHGFTFELDRTAAVIQSLVPTYFQVFMQNVGTQATTYQLSATLGGGSGFRYVRNGATIASVTLQPGQVIAGGADGVSLEIISDTSNTLPLALTATARAEPATQLARTVIGSITIRPDFIRVASVVADPPFTSAAGPSVSVTTRLYNGLNTAQDIRASYVVRDAGGAVVFTSPTVAFTLPAQGAMLTPLALAPFNTTGFADGEYIVDVTITDPAAAAIPGGTGSGRVRVGLPVSAALVSTVEILSPGNQATRSSTQSLTLSGIVPLADPFTLIGQATTSGNSNSLAIIGNLAYVAGSEAVDIVDISNPANPVLVGSFAQGFVPASGYSLVRDLPGDRIAVMSSVSLNATGFDLRVYDVSNPLVPTLVSDTTIDQQFLTDFQAVGNTALVPTAADYFLSNVYVGPVGDLISVDLAAAGGPTITDQLFNTGTPSTGGPHQFGIELVDADTAYVASFTTSAALAGRRVGRLLVVDYSDPANLVLTRQVEIPATFKLYDVAISGNTALVVGTDNNDAGGVTTRFNTGHLVLITLDITDRDNPVVVSTEVTTATFPENQDGGLHYPKVVPVGGGEFAVSNVIVDGNPAILLVNASDPSDIRTAAFTNLGSVVDEITVAGGNLYATSDDGLLVFDIGDVESISVTAAVQVPVGRAHTFNITPDRIITAAGVDTLEWDRVLGAGISNQQITWVQNIPMSPGLFADITFGGTVAFNSQGTPGTITLPGTGVGTLGTFAIDPELRTVRPGETAEFTVSINDPDAGNAIYGLVVKGVPAAWANFPASIQANAQGQATFMLQLTPDANANLADYGFVIHGGNGFNAVGYAGGTLRVEGVPVNAPDPDSRGVVAQLTPATATAGQGTPAVYTIRVSNTGSATDTFNLAVSGLPVGVTAVLEQTSVVVPPGASNFREVRLVLTPAPGTAAGSIPLTITTTSATLPAVSTSAVGTLNVVAAGVDVGLNSATVVPGNSLLATIMNTGSATDTFDLAVAGPAGLVATLDSNTVTLNPGQSQVVPISTGAAAFALPGGMNLTVTAASRADAAARDAASADLLVPIAAGLVTRFDPAAKSLQVPGTEDFLLLVENTGNTEDAYVATITSTTGGLAATLFGLDGQPVQAIPVFRLPGLSSGAILVRSNTAAFGAGTVTVRIQSLNDPSRTASATAMLSVAIPQLPTATPRSVATDSPDSVLVTLGGTDSNVPPRNLSFSISAAPAHGTLGTLNGNTVTYLPNAGYVGPDSFAFTVNNGTSTSLPATVSIDIRPPRPVVLGYREFGVGAGAGHPANARFFNPNASERYARNAFPGLSGGVRVTSADFNGDGVADLVAGTGPGSVSLVVVFDGTSGNPIFSTQPFENQFVGGVFVAAGDITGDGIPDLVISPDESGGPRVRVFTGAGFGSIADFYGIDDPDFRGGARVAVGDVNGDGVGDLVVSAGFGGGPRIAVFNGLELSLGRQTRLLSDYFHFEPALRNGAYVAVGDINGDGFADVIGGGGPGGGPRVLALSGKDLLAFAPSQSEVVANFFGGDVNNRGGIRVVARDLDGDRRADLVVGDGAGAGSRVTGYLGVDIDPNATPSEAFAFDAYPGFSGGVFVG